MIAYNICCNDKPVFCVLIDGDLAEKAKDKMQEELFKNSGMAVEEYKENVSWEVIPCKVINENISAITEKIDYVNLLSGCCVDFNRARELDNKKLGYFTGVQSTWEWKWDRYEIEKLTCEEIFEIYWSLTRNDNTD